MAETDVKGAGLYQRQGIMLLLIWLLHLSNYA